jgi:Uma2 family endonuclease
MQSNATASPTERAAVFVTADVDSLIPSGEGRIMPDSAKMDTAPKILVEGQRLDQPTFHALYEAMPPGTRAELIDGVVFMPSPVGDAHGRDHVPVIVWLGYYAERTPGLEVLACATTILGWKSEPQPDALLRVLSDRGGRSHIERGYVAGAPELVVEVARATRYVDLGPKLRDYERAGVLEYVVRAIEPDELHWFSQEQGALVQKPPDADGLYRSTAFPGLWLDPVALLSGDTRRLRAVVDLGCGTPEHASFAARLAAAGRSS